FLLFFFLTAVAVLIGMRLWIRQMELDSGKSQQNLTDPYLIAFLRSGSNEALRVATVSLLDRGLLVNTGSTLSSKNTKSLELAQRPIEKAVLQHYFTPGPAHEIFKDKPATQACASYEKVLINQGLLANASVYMKRLLPVGVALAILVGICFAKINIAFSQGRHNVGFLVMLTLLAGIITVIIWRRRRTAQGDAMLGDLRSLFSRLKGRSKTMNGGGRTNEAAILAAVFGLSALPAASFPFMDKLYPAKAGNGSGCGTSSCSSSSSSSCGSSCGGGGGGGGCGG
ncbi:MAG: TIGR04222 domain-containing membrane protein, partial [Betaproteobacteria bacterium]